MKLIWFGLQSHTITPSGLIGRWEPWCDGGWLSWDSNWLNGGKQFWVGSTSDSSVKWRPGQTDKQSPSPEWETVAAITRCCPSDCAELAPEYRSEVGSWSGKSPPSSQTGLTEVTKKGAWVRMGSRWGEGSFLPTSGLTLWNPGR